MLREAENPRPEDIETASPRLESTDEPEPHPDQLEVRPEGGPPQVPLQKELFQAVRDLVRGAEYTDIAHTILRTRSLALRLHPGLAQMDFPGHPVPLTLIETPW